MMKTSIAFLITFASLCAISQSALVGYWRMDEASGNVSDSSGNGLTGVRANAGAGAVYGEATVAPGTYGALNVTPAIAASFGDSIDFGVNTSTNRSNFNIGTPDSVTNLISSAGGGTGTMSVMAWINLDSTTIGTQRIFGTGIGGVDGWAFGTNLSSLRFTTNGRADNVAPMPAGLVVGTWAHIAMTYENNSVEFFLNGNSLGVDANAGGFNDETATNYRFGATTNGQEQFTGTMDELRLYDEVLSLAEIRAAAIGIPEPSSLALIGLGGLALLGRRRH